MTEELSELVNCLVSRKKPTASQFKAVAFNRNDRTGGLPFLTITLRLSNMFSKVCMRENCYCLLYCHLSNVLKQYKCNGCFLAEQHYAGMVYKGLKLKLELQLPQYQHRKKDIQRPTSLLNPGFIKTKCAEQCFMFKILRKKNNS